VPRPREYEESRINTMVRLPSDLHQKVKADAKERGVSVNRLVEMALEAWVKLRR
jgi:predicted HicB family RNase H-like nuclease